MATRQYDQLREIVHQPDVYFTTGKALPILVCGPSLTMDWRNGQEDTGAWHHPDLGTRGEWISQEEATARGLPGVVSYRRCRFCGWAVVLE